MREIAMGIKGALSLLLSGDKEVYKIILLSLYISLTSTFFSSIIAIPMGLFLGRKEFKLKRIVVRGLYTLMSLPPVIAGLVVFLLLSRKGPLGFMKLNFTPTAMIIAQTMLIIPIITGLIYNAAKDKGMLIEMVGKTLGAHKLQIILLLVKELRLYIFTAIVTGFGRAISEVGAVMIVGGNIKGHTRVMTTTIAMLQSMGEYEMAIALGIVLLLLSFAINSILYHFQTGE